MQPITRKEVLGLGDYEQIRTHFRARVIEEKRARRVMLGSNMSATFENRDTVLYQIQEMLRTERITSEPGIAHEIETYNDLLPGASQVSMTLFIEIAEKEERERVLTELAGLEQHVGLEVGGTLYRATEKDRSVEGITRTTAVHYFKIDLDAGAVAAMRGGAVATVVIDHPRHALRVALDRATVASLARDFS
ncbi:MAG: DUF3501 family protein [Polyangiaceae bacterium]